MKYNPTHKLNTEKVPVTHFLDPKPYLIFCGANAQRVFIYFLLDEGYKSYTENKKHIYNPHVHVFSAMI
jgi:hypothetical protein